MLLERISISLLLMASMAGAFAGPGNDREEREDSRAARQQQRAMERNENQAGRGQNQEQYRRPDNNGGNQAGRENNRSTDDGSRKHGRLTPEERQALRRQINEAGHDIYLNKP